MATTEKRRKAGYTFAIILTLLMLLACNTEEVHIPAVALLRIAEQYPEVFSRLH